MEKHKFFTDDFDESTNVKLELFKLYIRQWLPVFLSPLELRYPKVNIYDFFSGPGKDENGNPGSPLIIYNELKDYCENRNKNPNVKIQIHYNDKNSKHIELLKTSINDLLCDKSCCKINFTNKDFLEAFNCVFPDIKSGATANLLILDQFGMSQITEEVFNRLVSCETTDILFFISSSHIKRFIQLPEIKKYFKDLDSEIKNVMNKDIHRYICQYYESMIPSTSNYYVSPFSIKKPKSGNIYGIIFGTHSLLGLKKFLEACWKLDGTTGEANFDIDNDGGIRDGQLNLFPEMNKIKKQEQFYLDLENELKNKKLINNRLIHLKHSNHSIYRFILSKGFLPRHANEHLKKLQNEGRLIVEGGNERKGAFYLDNRKVNVYFTLKD